MKLGTRVLLALGWLLLSLVSACRPAPADIPKAAATAACQPLPAGEAEALLSEANALIEAAGEHPEPEALAQILPKLRKAAYGGLHTAQLRYGSYVVGYYATDEMFWPSDRETAIGALGLLRFAVLRDPAQVPNFPGLERTPPDPDSPFIQLLDPEWLSLALEEARTYETCVSGL